MVSAFDRIIITVPDLPAAAEDYRLLLGMSPSAERVVRGVPVVWFLLANTVIELEQAEVDEPAIRAIALRSDSAASDDQHLENKLELDLYLCDGADTSEQRKRQTSSQDMRVDHLVLRTPDAEDCIELFSEKLGIRLALDRSVPEWGGRMLFFRAGKLTLEVIATDEAVDTGSGSSFWGLAFQCSDIEQCVE